MTRDVPKKRPCAKLCYPSRGAAEAAIASLLRRHPEIVYKRAYRCGRCKAWHVTSTPRSPTLPSRIKH
jgi:hypothetical protein